ncbi:MAG: beta-lactamase family protein [Firmicutes bacterium]|nr:beta-lactamase family protein [Bacillota bacterium]
MKAAKLLTVILAALLLCAFTAPAQAASPTLSGTNKDIASYIAESAQKSDVPGIAAGILTESETEFYTYGYADRKNQIPVSDTTYFELGSVSKSYTALAILLLDERGALSLSDPITKYIPWLSFTFEGSPVDMEKLTVASILYHTSGLTNQSHIKLVLLEGSGNMHEKNVRALNGAELDFEPLSRYEYGTANYNILGYLIEVVSKQSYEEFLKTQILIPLGLDKNTFVQKEDIPVGQMSVGHKPSFLKSRSFKTPQAMYEGNKPAGHIIASAQGVIEWLKIQLGITYISDEWSALIAKSQAPDKSVAAVDGFYYAAGWLVSEDGKMLYHDGEIPNFTARVSFFPDTQTAVCVLLNSTSADFIALSNGIAAILDGGAPALAGGSLYALLDKIAVYASIVLAIVLLILLIMLVKRIKKIRRGAAKIKKPSIKGFILLAAMLGLAAAAIFATIIFPSLFGLYWGGLFNAFVSPAVPTALALLCGVSVVLFAHTLTAVSSKKI